MAKLRTNSKDITAIIDHAKAYKISVLEIIPDGKDFIIITDKNFPEEENGPLKLYDDEIKSFLPVKKKVSTWP